MSIQNEINRIKSNVAEAYSAVENKGGTVPEQAVSDNLAAAIMTIPEGGSGQPTSSGVPSGFIGMWSGEIVPDGWALCDGANGTPDLRGRFVLGNSETHAMGSTGGSEEVTLTVEQMPEHRHMIDYHNATSAGGSGKNVSSAYDTSTVLTRNAGSSQPHPNMPPYYVLAYIMKL